MSENTSKLVAQITPKIDISKLIDEAMEKKDRSVMVFISDVGTTVKVNPLDKPAWKPMPNKNGTKYTYMCSACNRSSDKAYVYCPWCGESIGLPSVEEQEQMLKAHREVTKSRYSKLNELCKEKLDSVDKEKENDQN